VVSLAVGLAFALREAHIAKVQRARAEQRFNDVRALANSLIFDVHDSIEDLPGSTAARKLIIEKAVHYLDSLSSESQDDLTLQRELATGYKRIGDVQGNEYVANLGDSAGALASYQKSLDIRKAVFSTDPASLSDAVSLAEALRSVAEAQLVKGQTDEAWKNSQRAVEVILPLETAHPDDLQILKELADDYTTEATVLGGNFNLSNLGDAASALIAREKQAEIWEKISRLEPNNDNKGSWAIALTLLGDQHLLMGERHSALEYYLRSQKMFEDVGISSTSRKGQDRLYSIYNRLCSVQQGTGNLPEALGYGRKALDVARKLSLADPNDVHSKISLVITTANLADILSSMHRFEPAISSLNQALSLIDGLVAKNPNNGEFPGMQASTYVTAGDLYRRSGDYDLSVSYYRTAVKIFLRTHLQDPGNVDGALDLAGGYNQLGKSLILKGALDEATEVLHKALAISEPQAARNVNEESFYSAAESYAGLADAESRRAGTHQPRQVQIQHLEQSRQWDETSLQWWSHVKEPGYLSPNGYDVIQPSAVRQHLARVNSGLVQLGVKRTS